MLGRENVATNNTIHKLDTVYPAHSFLNWINDYLCLDASSDAIRHTTDAMRHLNMSIT